MSRTDDDLFSLFEAVLGEQASEEQIRGLDTLLAEDSQALELFVLFTQQEVDLRHTLKTDCIHSTDLSVAPLTAETLLSRRRVSKTSIKLIVAVLSSAAALLIVAGLIHYRTSPLQPPVEVAREVTGAKFDDASFVVSKPPAPVAVLTAENDAVWQGPKVFLGQSLREGDAVTLVKGEARISMGFGAEIAAKGPCALRIVSRDRVQLEFGEVAVHVADWAHGFTVETPAMDVVDLGTTFVVSASSDDSAETSVIKGQVRVSPHKTIEGSPRSVLVSEGEALTVESTGRQLSTQSVPESTAQLIDFGAEEPFRPIGLHNSGYGFDVGDEDPYWRVIKGPKKTFSRPQYAIVCVPDERYMPNDRKSSQWVSMVNWRKADPNSTYTFQTTFDLTGFDRATVQLFGRFLADNGIKEVRVNGKPAILESWVDNTPGQHFSQPQFRSVNVSEGLIEGTNTIEIDVWNGLMLPADKNRATPNPMALRVEWEGFGRPRPSRNRSTDENEKQARLQSPSVRATQLH